MTVGDESGSRQGQIVALLVRRGSMTIAELADSLGLAKTSLRPQLERLVLQGWLNRDRRRQGPGRPADIYSVSAQSRQRCAQESTDEFARFLLEEVADGETRSKVKSVIAGVGRRLVGQLRPIVGEGPPGERAERLSKYLGERGILNDTGRSAQGVTLTIYTCPYVGSAAKYREICAMHRGALAELLDARTRVVGCIHEGHRHCEFRIEVPLRRPKAGTRKRARSTSARKAPRRRK